MKGWLKAGLVGGVVGIVLTIPAILMFYLPILVGLFMTTCASTLFLLLYPGVGILAAYLSPPPRTPKQGGIDGALAGLIAFSLDSLATFALILIPILTGKYEHYVLQILPWIPRDVFETSFVPMIVVFIISLLINILIGILFSALGGLVFASAKKE